MYLNKFMLLLQFSSITISTLIPEKALLESNFKIESDSYSIDNNYDINENNSIDSFDTNSSLELDKDIFSDLDSIDLYLSEPNLSDLEEDDKYDISIM